MKPFLIDVDPANTDTDGLADNNDSSGTSLVLDGALISGRDTDGLADNNDSSGSSLTLDGALINSQGKYVAADGVGHLMTIIDTATVDQSGATFIVVGKDDNNSAVEERITGPGSGLTVIGSQLFKEVSEVRIESAAACGTVDMGPLGVFVSADDLGRRVQITDTATTSQAAATFTVTGRDVNDEVITEAITGPGSGATVTSTEYFKVISSVAIASGVACATVDMGTADEAESRIYPIDRHSRTAAGVAVTVTGTIDYTVEESFQDILDPNASVIAARFVDIAALADKTATLGESATVNATALRVVVNSFTNGAELAVDVSQAAKG